jgi:uncharacterized membrane protein YeaQ/YmgE (transglycosylase-associated protein family)
MGLLSWMVVGAVVGLVAKETVPGPDPGRLFISVMLGMAGASSGGFVVGVKGGSGAAGFSVGSLLASLLGAVLWLFLYGLIARRSA